MSTLEQDKKKKKSESSVAPWLVGGVAGGGALALAAYLKAKRDGAAVPQEKTFAEKMTAPGILTNVGTGLAGAAYGKALAPKLVGRASTPAEIAQLSRQLPPGVSIHNAEDLVAKGDKRHAMLPKGNSYFDPAENRVVLDKNLSSPGVVAHEIGHARTVGRLQRARTLSGLPAMAGMAASQLTADSDSEGVRAAGLAAGTLPQAVILADELRASHAGGKILQGMGKSRWGAYVGLPSYALMAAAPLAGYLAGGKNKPEAQ